MPGWREAERKVSFEDVPSDLSGEALTSWLEEHGLSVVDFFAWKRTQDPAASKRPPSRRRHLTHEQATRLDAELEREGFQW